jgi:hypothetical protein
MLALRASFEVAHLHFAPKVLQQISPGQRPGLSERKAIKPCKGETTHRRAAICCALSGRRILSPALTQGVALG